MTGFIDTLCTVLGTTGNTAHSLIYTLYSSPLHTHYGSQPSLVVSWQRTYNSLSLQITHGVFFSQPNSFLTIILKLPIPKTRLNSIPRSHSGRLASRNSTLPSTRLLFYTAEYFLITTLHGPSRKHSLTFTDPLPSNRRPTVTRWLPRECV
jgi:hypothetical protein